MDVPLLKDSNETVPDPVSALLSLEQVTTYISSLGEDKALEDHLLKKLRKNWQSFQIPPGDEITALTKMQDGFVLGLHSGKALLVSPPASLIIDLHSGPVIGLFAASNYFIFSASQSELKVWNAQEEVLTKTFQSGGPIVCVSGNMVKEVIFVGLGNGSIEQYAIKDKQKCELTLKSTFHKEGEESSAYDIKTNDSTTWIAARYLSNALILWDHVEGSLLYHFTFTAGPGLPNSWLLGERTNLPKWFSPDKGWDVFPDCIVFSSPLLLRMHGNRVEKMYSSRRLTEPDDNRWQAYGDNLKKGHVSTLYEDTLITFTKPGAGKKNPSEKVINEVEIDLGLNFSFVERSEANNYLAFACKNSLEVVCLAAIESAFVHRTAGPVVFSKTQGYLYTRFHKVLTQSGQALVALGVRERALKFSPDGQWLMCTSERRDSKSSATFSITNVHKPDLKLTLSEPWAQDQLLRKKFSKDSKFAALLFSKGLVVFSLEDQTIVFTLEGKFRKETSRPKYRGNGSLLVTDNNRLLIINPVRGKYTELPWHYSKLCFLGEESAGAIAYNMTKTAHIAIDLTSLTQNHEKNEGFELVKALNSHQHCVGSNDSGIFLFSAADLTTLLHIKPGHQVTVSRKNPLLFAFCFDAESPVYGMVDVWDLKTGKKAKTVYLGLNHVFDNKLVIRGPGMWREPKIKNITHQDTSSASIKDTWVFNLDQFASIGESVRPESISEMSFFEESLEKHCVLWKKLTNLLNVGELTEDVTKVLIKPFNVNVLHLMANQGQAVLLAQALELGTSIIKSVFGTPVTLCLAHKSRKCLNELLSGLITLRETNPTSFITALAHVSDDLPDLISFGSTLLAEFLQLVIVPLPEEMKTQTVIHPRFELPDVKLSENLWVDVEKYEVDKPDPKERLAVEFLICPIPVHIELGSKESISTLDNFTSNQKDMSLFKTLYIKTIINLKWSQLWPFILVETVFYWILLGVLVCLMFGYFNQYILQWVFFGLNTWFLLIELIQMSTAFVEYTRDCWNYVDLARAILSYLWVFSVFQQWLTFFVVLLSLLRGLTTFETFDATRFYVRMVFTVTQEILSFIWVFFYSTLSFGLLFASVNPDPSTGFFTSWMIPYELNMGNFDVDNRGSWYWMVFMVAALINVVIMLNLVVSILGDAFEKFQSIAEAADILGKAEVLYEYELMMKWRRNSGRPRYLQICRDEGSVDEVAVWTGKVEEMKKELKKVEGKLSNKLKAARQKKRKQEAGGKNEVLLSRINEATASMEGKIGQLKSEMEQIKKLLQTTLIAK